MSQIDDVQFEFSRHKRLADAAMKHLSDEQFFAKPTAVTNSIALIVKHLAGNLQSRWTDFLTTDGDKPSRDRDSEFLITPADTRENLMRQWETGWEVLFVALKSVTDTDLTRILKIRGEPFTLLQAFLRAATHAAYHTGQICQLARMVHPNQPWLTIAPGESRNQRGNYFGRT